MRGETVLANVRSAGLHVLIIGVALWALAPQRATAVTVDVAKKCNALVSKAFPPRVPGNPAAGSAKGTPQDVREFYQKCVANRGNVDDTTGAQPK
jgi:hypothetical protein